MTWRERNKAFLPDPTSPAYQAQVEELREAERRRENRTTKPMGKFKTQRGDVIDLPDDTGSLRRHADDLYAEAVETFDEIRVAAKRQAELDQVTSVDRRRFPVIGE